MMNDDGYSGTCRRDFLKGAALLGVGVLAGCSNSAQAESSATSPLLACTLDDLIARQNIEQVLRSYCRAIDRLDIELGYSVFWPDSYVDYGASVFQGTGQGFVDWCIAQNKALFCGLHRLMNISIALHGDRAGSESYCYTNAETNANSSGTIYESVSFVRYIDNFEKRNNEWKIIKRHVSYDIDYLREMSGQLMAKPIRDKTDPSYAVLS